MDIINLYENYNCYFDAEFKAIFELCSKIALKKGFKLYLIGGIVRDMLLSTNVVLSVSETSQSKEILRLSPQNDAGFVDIDITVEGDAIEFAQILKQECDAKILSIHHDFGTVKVEINGEKIDFASTRSETYPKKGHLPRVDKIGCSLKDDVIRRDFTVNSLALSLNHEDFADLIDYVGGYEDLKNKKIKVLHDKSFIDDPTRIIRALKYSSRLGFDLDKKTLKLQQDYLNNINYDMCYKRVKQEIKKTFDDCKCGTFDSFINDGIYRLITPHPCPLPQGERGIKPQLNIEKLIAKYKPKYPWLVCFGVVVIDENLDKFELTKSERDIVENVKLFKDKKLSSDFEIYKAFNNQKVETLLILAFSGKEKEVLHYLDNLKKIKLKINGEDLIKLGFKPSKEFSTILDYVLNEKLKTPALNKKQELELLRRKFIKDID